LRSAVIPAPAGIPLLCVCLFAIPVLTQAADRVVTLSPHLAELVCAAGACDKLAGVVAYSDYPPEVRRRPQVGDAFAVNVEAVLALQPDLVLAWEGGTPREIQERLRGLRLRVEAVRVQGLDDVAAALRALGGWLGNDAQAEAAAQRYESRLQQMRLQQSGASPLRVLYQIERDPVYTISRDSPISQAMELCGGVNVFADLPQLAAPVSREAVLAVDPEVIVFSEQDDGAAIRRDWSRGPSVTAGRAGTLYAIDANLLARATPRLLDGAERLCAAFSDARAKLSSRSSRDRRANAPASAP
jgi:iron complex transport system substrate-binding protein